MSPDVITFLKYKGGLRNYFPKPKEGIDSILEARIVLDLKKVRSMER